MLKWYNERVSWSWVISLQALPVAWWLLLMGDVGFEKGMRMLCSPHFLHPLIRWSYPCLPCASSRPFWQAARAFKVMYQRTTSISTTNLLLYQTSSHKTISLLAWPRVRASIMWHPRNA
jgi:hypothetical protein